MNNRKNRLACGMEFQKETPTTENHIKVIAERFSCKNGYTIIESIIVALIMLLVCMAIFNFSNISSRISAKGTLSSKLSEDCRSTMHMLVRELRENSLDNIYADTANDSEGHFAIGLAKPTKDSATETIELDAGNDILWGKTVIYHTYNDNGNIKLYRRQFNRTGGATEHQTEVNDCVNTYDGSLDVEIMDELKLKDGADRVSYINEETNYIDIKFTVESEMKYNPIQKTKTVTLTTEVRPMNTGGE